MTSEVVVAACVAVEASRRLRATVTIPGVTAGTAALMQRERRGGGAGGGAHEGWSLSGPCGDEGRERRGGGGGGGGGGRGSGMDCEKADLNSS